MSVLPRRALAWLKGVSGSSGRSNEPLVSIVINTYNRCDSLERTLLALQRQTYPLFEVVVVNGPSTDGTATMLERFRKSARVVTCPEASLGLSRNIGTAAAAGSIVAFTDDDAIPNDDWIERLVAGFGDATVGAVGGTVFDVPQDRVLWKLCTCNRLGIGNTDSAGTIGDYQGSGANPFAYLAGCNMAFRRSALVDVGGFNALLPWVYDDVDICCRIIDADYRIAFEAAAYVRHDRASNAARDDQQVLRDPYGLMFARAVFALQCSPTPYSRHEITASLEAAMKDWRYTADQHLANGIMDKRECERYLERASNGIADGIKAGQDPRPVASLPRAPAWRFRPYLR